MLVTAVSISHRSKYPTPRSSFTPSTDQTSWGGRLGAQGSGVDKMRGSTDASGQDVNLLNSEVHPATAPSPPSSTPTLPSFHTLLRNIHSNTLPSECTEISPRSSISCSTRSPSPPYRTSSKSSPASATSLETNSSMASDYSYDAMDHSKTLVPNNTYLQQNAQFYPPMPQAQTAIQHPYYISTRQMNGIGREFQYVPDQTLEPNLQFHASEPNPTMLSQDPQLASSAPANPATPLQKIHKKKYPCPHREEYKCPDTFTTSGHAARHGKKHTGEKNVTCPQCGKAFTRKDNMKQHERTHDREKDKSASKPSSSSSNTTLITPESGRPAKSARSRSSTAPPTPLLEEQTEMGNSKSDTTDLCRMESTPRLTRPQMHIQMPDNFNFAQHVRSRAGEAVGSGSSGEDCEGESPGLDALAFAAHRMST